MEFSGNTGVKTFLLYRSVCVGDSGFAFSGFCTSGQNRDIFNDLASGGYIIAFDLHTGGRNVYLVLYCLDWESLDFFNHVFYVQDPGRVYDVNFNACFPPLAYIFYWLIAQMLPENAVVMDNPSFLTSYALLLYVSYHVFLGIMFYYCINKLYVARGGKERNGLLLTISICMSGIFIFSVVWTGNAALIACILLIRVMDLRESEDKAKRELALIFIAIAAGLKIYPAIFGILYLKEKRYREASRLVIYGMLCFFVPFIFFGGIHGMIQMFRNQQELHSQIYYNWKSIQAAWNQVDNRFLHLNLQIVGKILTFVYAGIAMAGVWLSNEIWKRMFLLCSIMIIVPFWAGSYTPIYLTIPLIYFLCEKRTKGIDYVYAILFAGIFCLFVWNTPLIINITGDLSFAIRYMSIYMMCFLLIVETIFKIIFKLIFENMEIK